jgi:RNA:NAD 2'-phosphotransferase (TPT1/KptA family)
MDGVQVRETWVHMASYDCCHPTPAPRRHSNQIVIFLANAALRRTLFLKASNETVLLPTVVPEEIDLRHAQSCIRYE